MAVKKQPDSKSATISEGANDWFRQFLKHLELSWSEIGQTIPSDATPEDYGLATMRAVKMTLLDSGLNDEQVLGLLGLVAFEKAILSRRPEWTAELNKRRFELIDGDIQGTRNRGQTLRGWLGECLLCLRRRRSIRSPNRLGLGAPPLCPIPWLRLWA